MPENMYASDRADFREHVERSLLFAKGKPSSPAHHRGFIPRHDLQSYLTPSQLRKLLGISGNWEAIQNGYLMIFSILVFIGKGIYITFFIPFDELDDEHLPFRHSQDWPRDCLEFFDQFFKAQWHFCAQALKKGRLCDARFPPEAIVPFTRCEPLKEGPASSTWVVDIHPEYDLLTDSNNDDNPTTHTYVLKTCREKDATYHHREVEAYTLLIQQKDVSQSMVRFHGSWIHNQTYNMLLEYVGGGTLTEFFERVDPPSRDDDRIKFWESMLELVKFVSRIHKLPESNKQRSYRQGIHHDIKADNILVSHATGSSRYDVTFKLADLGLSDFAVAVEPGQEVESLDAHGTQMYSAPEYCRDDKFLQLSTLLAKPSKDIWSLGCVFSEAAVWAVCGIKGLQEYLKLRTIETNAIPGLRDAAYSGCFHDGSKVLDAVIKTHIHVRWQRRNNDHVIWDIIPIIEDMLEEVSSRPGAIELYRRFRKALDTARATLKKERDDTDDEMFPGPFRTSTSNTMGPDLTRSPPPILPPGEIYGNGLGVNFSETPPQSPNGFENQRPRISNGIVTSSPSLPRHQSLDKHNSVTPVFKPPRRSVSVDEKVRYSDGSRHSMQTGSPTARHPSWITPQITPEEDEVGSVSGTKSRNGSLHAPKPRSSPTSQHASNGDINHPSVQPISPPFTITKPNGTAKGKQKMKTKMEYPEISIAQVLKWIDEKKINADIDDLNGHEFLGRLHGRDQVFLIDDSISMKPHWSNVKDTLNALGYLVKRSDLDGIDLYFTNCAAEGHSKDRKKLNKVFNGVKPGGRCNMKLALGRILEAYHPQRIKDQDKGLFSWKTKKSQKWGLSVYVLTDGVWEDGHDELCGVHEPIATLVNKLIKKGMVQNHVGIQFIQFGASEIGARRLNSLDIGLREFGVTKDIVDTEDFGGNVWKMLLAHFDEYFDNDPPKSISTADVA